MRRWSLAVALAVLACCAPLTAQQPNAVRLGQAAQLLEDGRFDEAVTMLRASERSGESPDTIARLLLSDAYQRLRADDLSGSLKRVITAKVFAEAPELRAECDFWHGWVLYQQAKLIGAPQISEPARRMYQEAWDLLEAGQKYASQSGLNITLLMESVGMVRKEVPPIKRER